MALPSIAATTAFGGKRGSFAIAPTDGSSDRERVESSGVDSEAFHRGVASVRPQRVHALRKGKDSFLTKKKEERETRD